MVTTPIGVDDLGTAVAIQSDGKIVLSGYSFSGSDDFAVVRYNADFTLDVSFGTGGIVTTPIGAGQDRAEAMALQADGKIVVAGHANIGGNNDFAVVRYNLDGSVDTSFNPAGGFGDAPNVAGMVVTAISGGNDEIEGVAIQQNGQIVVAGFTDSVGFDYVVARYNTNGSLDTAGFNSPNGFYVSGLATSDVANAVAIQPSDGKIVVAGWAFNGANDDFALARLNTNGTPDGGFGNVLINFPLNRRDRAHALIIQPADGKIIVAGEAQDAGNMAMFGAARRNPDGSPDLTFGAGGTMTTDFTGAHDIPFGMLLQTDDHIVLGGYSNWSGSGTTVDWALLRYDDLGGLDFSFDGDGKVTTDIGGDNDWLDSLALQSDGKIVGGGYSNNGADDDFGLVRYNPDGSVDNTCVTTNYRSIGVNPGILDNVGNASITAGANTVTFAGGASLLGPSGVGAVGTGDVLILDPGPSQEIFHILSRDSFTSVRVQVGAMATHTNVPFEIRRAYTTLQGWEDDRDGNLAGENRREMGYVYADGPFLPPYAVANAALLINDSTTDADRFMWLTAANGQRHDGVAGAGVVVDGEMGATQTKFGILDQDDYTRIDGLELVRFKKALDAGFAAIVTEGVGAIYQNLLIHDFFDGSVVGEGVRVSTSLGSWSFTIRNCIVYDGDRSAIRVDEPGATITVDNCTIRGMETHGVSVGAAGGTANVNNTISMDNGGNSFDAGSGTLNQSNNISSDGTGTLTFRSATDVPTAVPGSVVFNNIAAGTEDYHLQTSTVNDAVDMGADLSTSFTFDIDGNPRLSLWDIGADDLANATAVELASFDAVGLDGAVQLAWRTSSELDNLGFHLYRSLSEDGPFERITTHAIPGLGSSPVGAHYEYRDTGLTNRLTYYYKLEDIETTGKVALHGPVSATPAVSSPSNGDGASDTTAALITYGDPSGNTMRVLKRGPRLVEVELRTEGFYAEPQEDGSVRITIPDFIEPSESGSPSIPVRWTWLDALAGRHADLVSVKARGVEAFTGLVPSDMAAPEIVAGADGTVRIARRRASRRRAAEESGGLFPSAASRVVSVGFQGETSKALVELAPLRWDASTGELLLARRLVVRLSFRRRDGAKRSPDGLSGRDVVARLTTREAGVYAVRFGEVFGRRRGVRASKLRLSRQGDSVAFHLEPKARRFRPGSTLYFVSEGEALNPYGREAVYELELAAGEMMDELSVAPSGRDTTFYWETVTREENRLYQAALVEAPDRWLWDLLFAPDVESYAFEVSDVVLGGEASRLKVWLQGASDFEASKDHHVRLSLNGVPVHDSSWDGKQAQKIDTDFPTELLRDGENLLEIENVGDTEAAYSMVLLNRFELVYPRAPIAENGRLEGVWGATGNGDVAGLGGVAHVLDTTQTPRWLRGAESTPDGTLRFRAEEGRRYVVVREGMTLRPGVSGASASGLRSPRNRADYIVIGPEAFLSAAAPLLQLRESQGLRVKAVAIEDIFAEFGFGESTPGAVRDFLTHAYHEWRGPAVHYVLLLGDASFDFKDDLQTGVANHVPSLIVKTSYLWTASDPAYAAVNGEDLLPDLAIGRLPAASFTEARVMVEKIVAWETGGGTLRGGVVLVTDDPDGAGDFDADAEALASGILASRDPRRVFLSELGSAATHDSILDAFDDGVSLMSYLGHGGIHLWADENVLNNQDVESLAPQGQQPLLLTMNCLNGYFHFPYFDSLAEALVKAGNKGAIAAFSPSGLSLNDPAHRYHEALLAELLHGNHVRLGDAILAAQRAYAETGALPELLYIYHLLGDPALRIQ